MLFATGAYRPEGYRTGYQNVSKPLTARRLRAIRRDLERQCFVNGGSLDGVSGLQVEAGEILQLAVYALEAASSSPPGLTWGGFRQWVAELGPKACCGSPGDHAPVARYLRGHYPLAIVAPAFWMEANGALHEMPAWAAVLDTRLRASVGRHDVLLSGVLAAVLDDMEHDGVAPVEAT